MAPHVATIILLYDFINLLARHRLCIFFRVQYAIEHTQCYYPKYQLNNPPQQLEQLLDNPPQEAEGSQQDLLQPAFLLLFDFSFAVLVVALLIVAFLVRLFCLFVIAIFVIILP